MSRSLVTALVALALLAPLPSARAADPNAPVDYPREWGPDLCLGENGTRVIDTSSSATASDTLVDGLAGEGHQWEPAWANGLPASFTLRLPKVERVNKLVFTTRTSGDGFPREGELWVGRTQADLHCERTFSLAKQNVQTADFDPVEGQFFRVVVKSSWRDDEVEIGEVALFFHAAAPPHATEGKDSVEVRGGDKLFGELQGDAWTFHGRFFETKIARADFVAASLSDDGDRVYLASGEVLAGTLDMDKVALKLENGPTVELPRAKVVSVAPRARKADFPARPEDLTAKGPVLVLASGERWIARLEAPRVEVQTTFGKLELSVDAIQSIVFGQGSEPLDKIALREGDSLSGFVLSPAEDAIPVKLLLGPTVAVPRALVERIAFAPVPDDAGAGAPENQRVTLKTGDVLSGTIGADKLPVRTSYAVIAVPLDAIDAVEAADAGRFRLSLRDGSRIVGRPEVDALPFDLDVGGRVQLPIDRVRSVENWRLPAETLAKVDALVKKLDDPSWPVRDGAKSELAKLGKLALPRLTKLLRAGTPEEKKSATEILGLIRAGDGSPGK